MSIERDLQDGKLEQRCPKCGMTEAAGAYCTADWTPTGEAHWYRPVASESRIAGLAAARAARSGQAGAAKPAALLSTATNDGTLGL